jgi:hypothetical protein
MKQVMLKVPPFDANAANYALQLMERMTVPSNEVMAFLTLQLALQEVANPSTQESNEE